MPRAQVAYDFNIEAMRGEYGTAKQSYKPLAQLFQCENGTDQNLPHDRIPAINKGDAKCIISIMSPRANNIAHLD